MTGPAAGGHCQPGPKFDPEPYHVDRFPLGKFKKHPRTSVSTIIFLLSYSIAIAMSIKPSKNTFNPPSPDPMTVSPKALAHVVLRTNNFKSMVDYYAIFLGAEVIFNNGTFAFLSYDDEHHRIAFIRIPGLKAKDESMCGLDHTAFSFDTLGELLFSYQQRKEAGIVPFWSVNHGPTTSIYYRDPDGNKIETQVDNLDSPDKATDFMNSKVFAENPIGTDFDPEDYLVRLSSGTTEEQLKKRVEIGPRTGR